MRKMNVRRKLLIAALGVLLASVALAFFLHTCYRVPILMYHSIAPASNPNDRLTISPEAFERQMVFLKKNGFNVVPLEKAVSYLAHNGRAPFKSVAITMDDGLENNYRNAYPVLKKYRLPATIFVIIDRVGKEGYLTWDQIAEMSGSGIVDIESHTISHYWLTGLDDKALKTELEASKVILESRLKRPVPFVCYPMGTYDVRVKSGARAAGYRAAFATKIKTFFAHGDLYAIGRIRVSHTSDNLFVFAFKVSGYYAFFRVLQDRI